MNIDKRVENINESYFKKKSGEDNMSDHKNSKISLKNVYSVYFNSHNCNDEKDHFFNYSNKISTSKYTWYNCIPKIVIEQFTKAANIYFLMIAILQSIDEISISGGKPVILLPLITVVMLNGIKDFFEDLKRKKSDDEENNKKCYVFDQQSKTFIKKPWEDLSVGEIIKIQENEEFPADLLMIHSSNLDGNCYIETKNLDGETNLKIKQSEGLLSQICCDENGISQFSGVLYTKNPNENIFEFDATLRLTNLAPKKINSYNKINDIENHINKKDFCLSDSTDDIQITVKSFLLRGCSLKLTKFTYGLIIFTGHRTKIMKNSPNAKSKTSRVEDVMNFQILIIFIFQICLSILGSILYITWKHSNKDILGNYIFPEYSKKEKVIVYAIIARIGTWILIFTNFVPISLLLTMEMVKYFQGMFISWDINLYCKETNNPALVQTSTLNEELGQIQFVFSDKTGTLTKNNMKFKNIAVGKNIYGNDNEDFPNHRVSDKFGEITNIHFKDENLKKILSDNTYNNFTDLDMFMKCLAICHSVIVEKDEFKNIEYHASSMDEKALVNGARYLNYIYKEKDLKNNIILEINGQDQIFELLNVIDFDSKRKRMSVIVKEKSTKKIILFMKGSDSILRALTTKNREYLQINEQQLIDFCSMGLRNFNIGYTLIEEEKYVQWNELYKRAINPLNIDLKIEEVVALIEKDLYLLGTAAIEDELQDLVENTLEALIKNGIKVWMLTGDQKLTAKSIGRSCKLITNEYEIIEIDEESNYEKIRVKLEEASRKTFFSMNKLSLIVGTDDISTIFINNDLKEQFFEVSVKMDSVIIFRATPKQKAEVVELIKNRSNYISTLAIGDGANDVNMITSAHVGVGIIGEEGKQAARASDYSIGQFSYLKRLLFVHGRESYRKNTFIVCYNFYKNCLFVIPQFWFGFQSMFSGQTLYDPWIYQLYNILFTSLPIIWFGVYDLESDHEQLERSGKHYVQGIIGKLFHSARFWKWVLTGALQGLILFVFYFYSMFTLEDNGCYQDLWSIGSMVYFAIVLVANIRLFYTTNNHTWISFVLIFGSIISYTIVLGNMSKYSVFENFNNFYMIMNSIKFYLVCILSIVLCLIVDVGVGKLLVLYGIIYDPLKMDINQINEYNRVSFKDKKKMMLTETNKLDQYKTVNIADN